MGLVNSIIARCGYRLTENVAQLAQSDLIALGKNALALRAKAKACSAEASIEMGQ